VLLGKAALFLKNIIYMEAKIIYMKPDAKDKASWFNSLSKDDKLKVAEKSSDYEIYSLKDFEIAFNEELISDLGFIFIV
jgi:hypothetical protein